MGLASTYIGQKLARYYLGKYYNRAKQTKQLIPGTSAASHQIIQGFARAGGQIRHIWIILKYVSFTLPLSYSFPPKLREFVNL